MLIVFSALLLGGGAPAPCPAAPQPMPPAIDSIGPPPPAVETVEFAAAPWEVPGRAWVFRLSRRGDVVTLEIVRLLQRYTCNVWDIEQVWRTTVAAADYRSLIERIRPWSTPPQGFPANHGTAEIALDGTGLALRVRTSSGWQVTRTLNHYGRSGPQLSGIFRALLTRYVPADELPGEDWRTRGVREDRPAERR